jgi:hypothetical protein
MELQFVELDKGEKSRTYVFPQGEVTIMDVARICFRPSGSHRLECTNGTKYVIPAGFLAIKVEADQWSV